MRVEETYRFQWKNDIYLKKRWGVRVGKRKGKGEDFMHNILFRKLWDM